MVFVGWVKVIYCGILQFPYERIGFIDVNYLLLQMRIEVHLIHWQDYVIVLLRNGRGKDHAKNKLNVFLGEDSDSFVSW